MINIEDFKKVEIKIGKVISAEKIPEGDKLLKLIFDMGGEQRQVMSGIAEFYSDPSILVGKEMPVVVNIEPRKLKGYESQGMIMAADVDGRPVLLYPETEVAPGSIVK
ncbi:MAG: methionine--tRNA ligase subunit beta [Candidatus Nomurabacteria bacterium]|nr:methionine--tRNA ligase subunit beta [Candidatus Nomurabacteria bacterium]